MAREDFCFTYYDGDAARDKAHMTRLERGAYDDIISAQRKFGRLSMEILKRVLGSDFIACWSSIEIILKKDETGKFYIEWVEKSIEKTRENSKKNKDKIDKYWREKREKENNSNTDVLPQYQKTDTNVIPLEYGFGFELESGIKEGGAGGNGIVVDMVNVYKQKFQQYPIDQERDYKACLSIAYKIADNQNIPRNTVVTKNRNVIRMRWGEIVEFVSKDKWFKGRSISDLDNEWQRLTNTMYANQGNSQQSVSKTINAGGSFGKL